MLTWTNQNPTHTGLIHAELDIESLTQNLDMQKKKKSKNPQNSETAEGEPWYGEGAL